ncbi:MAG: hypothetical protein H7Y42_11875 [Chitinophagaceae bacterium]|nr:hypothetical protein [Chitinophagaceae bacterium]
MKAILYTAAALMAGASIYGFIDYRGASNNDEFTKLYDVKSVSVPEPKEAKASIRELQVSEHKIVVEEVPSNSKSEAITVTKKKEVRKAVKRTARKKRMNLDKFSRAPLREEFILPEGERQ